ncbi:MAG: ribonuclease III [Dehalococcoidia bacterium]|nr:ribonuclease III [Dehalococcoidia bacterium]
MDGATLEERLGIKPLPAETLRQALTHASYVNESDATAASNDRLEFLGDALLSIVVADRLYRSFPDVGEGQLTRMRAEVVRGSTLADVARRLGLGDEMILGRGEESAGGRERERNLAGLYEAVVGAIFVEQGYRASRTFALRTLADELRAVRTGGGNMDAKSSLQHLVQSRWHEPPDYVTVEETSGERARRFTVEVVVQGRVLGRGVGPSKRQAQQEAAREAIDQLVDEGGEGA